MLFVPQKPHIILKASFPLLLLKDQQMEVKELAQRHTARKLQTCLTERSRTWEKGNTIIYLETKLLNPAHIS